MTPGQLTRRAGPAGRAKCPAGRACSGRAAFQTARRWRRTDLFEKKKTDQSECSFGSRSSYRNRKSRNEASRFFCGPPSTRQINPDDRTDQSESSVGFRSPCRTETSISQSAIASVPIDRRPQRRIPAGMEFCFFSLGGFHSFSFLHHSITVWLAICFRPGQSIDRLSSF